MKKILIAMIAVFSVVFATSCATPRSTNVEHTMNINVDISDLDFGERIEVAGSFSDMKIETGYALEVLTAEALRYTDYDFIFMPRVVRDGSNVTLFGRLAKIKRPR